MKPKVYVCLSVCLLLAGAILIQTTMPSTERLSALTNSSLSLLSDHSLKVAGKALPEDRRTRLVNTYRQLPLSFEANRGQTDSRVKFVSRGQGYTLFLRHRGDAVLALSKPEPKLDPLKLVALASAPEALESKPAGPAAVVKMELVGGNPRPRASGFDELPGKTNYFIGNDPNKWRTNVPMYGKVKFRAVYPGVDLVYYGKQRQLEHDFIVAPGADPHSIALNFAGVEKLSVDAHGSLVLRLEEGEIRLEKPHIYQEVDGKRRDVDGAYMLQGTKQVGFQVAAYDARKPLIIDPTLFYSTYLGGSGNDFGLGIAVDAAGNAYVTGFTLSTNFPTTPGAFQTAHAGADDAFVTKLNPTGSAPLVYSTYLGGSGVAIGIGVAVDASGNAYVTGDTGSTNFPTTPGAFQTTNAGGGDAFVTKLNPTGSALVYSTYLGGSGADVGESIAVDATDSAYVTGFTLSTNFPTTLGAFQTTSAGGIDAFVTKLNPTGSAPLVYSTYLGGSSNDFGLGIAVDAAGNAYVTGDTGSTNFPTTLGAFQTTSAGGEDAFVTKLNPTGSVPLVYSTYLGGSSNDFGLGIAVDAAGNAYVTGDTSSTNFPTTSNAFQTANAGADDAFVTKLNPTGSAPLVYSTYLGGSSSDTGRGIAVDTAGNAYVTGNTYSTNFPTTSNAFQTANAGGSDAFVTAFNPLGTASLIFSTYLGGSSYDEGNGIALDSLPNPNAYVTGYTDSTNFPTTAGAFQTANAGGFDAFVTKIANITMPPGSTVGKVTGGGIVDVTGGFANFGFIVQREASDQSIHGDLQYVNHASGTKIHSETFATFLITGDTATFSGTCTNNGAPCTFNVTVQDNDQTNGPDSFVISINGGPPEGGTLRDGDIEIHNQ